MVSRFLILLFLAFPAAGAEVAGVKLPDEDQKLVLNGAGLRKRAFFNVYVIGLYLPEKKTAAAEAIAASGPKRVVIHMMRDVEAAQFTDALLEGLIANLPEQEMKSATNPMQKLSEMMATVKVARSGMRFTLEWVPNKGTVFSMNDKALGPPIEGADFYRALMRIWLGERPVQADLKKALLGG